MLLFPLSKVKIRTFKEREIQCEMKTIKHCGKNEKKMYSLNKNFNGF